MTHADGHPAHPVLLPRRKIVGAAVLAAPALLLSRQAHAAQFTYKYGNNLPAAHPLNLRAQEAASRIAKESGGKIAIRIFPNNQLGSDTEMLSQVRSGALEFFTLSGLILATLVPVASINGVGFAFKDYGQVWPAMDGALGAHVRGAITKAGLIPMDKMWDNGFRQITSSTKPIATPADLKGFKIRVPISPLWTSMFKALGAAPTGINFNEVYSALQTHVADGEENPLAIIYTAKLYEVQKYCALTNHMWDGFWMLANRAAWMRLPADLQTIVARNWNESAVAQRADVAKLNSGLQGQLQAKGMKFNTPDELAFRDTLRKAGFYADWRKKYGAEAWGLLEKAVGKLA
ncbi:MAG TPA: TRAP transporter substrate-binding protein [Acetobacteraceae bacterium]|nr:TRAP transporter substrate-binding protein [Acetobacteraceae bacterium]